MGNRQPIILLNCKNRFRRNLEDCQKAKKLFRRLSKAKKISLLEEFEEAEAYRDREEYLYSCDVGSRLSDIDLLLGAHALGLIYTGKLIKLECGLTVVETHLGFALLGKDTKINQAKSLSTVHEKQKPRSTMSMLSNQILSLDIKKWWSLETIRIRDPVENLKERELNSEFIKRFEGSTWLYRERVRGLDNDKHRS
ncbi:hypothetical protein TNIN_461061 [Trichonephila inaurata madagascariensis]|uniref:Uncharacterized protein n=1 Tax=Trichonephila inaurata madagascariensis TaxID=2747483 RepID=A0A8X6MI14_9ARAC|nr:hypothetical protein TNIN_461061 [Trichonephila inaurata madagascariensis]